jgi:hypothetical protein
MEEPSVPIGQEVGWTITVIAEKDRAIAQAVSRRFSTVAARVQAQVMSCGICGTQSGTGAGFLLVLRLPHVDLHSTNFSTITITITYHLGLVQ